MPDTTHHALGERAAFQLANVTKTPPQYGAITRVGWCASSTGNRSRPGRWRVNRVAARRQSRGRLRAKEESALRRRSSLRGEAARVTLNSISSVLPGSTNDAGSALSSLARRRLETVVGRTRLTRSVRPRPVSSREAHQPTRVMRRMGGSW